MSRIDTQSDRLLRGTEGFERQRTFLVQPERFATRQDNSASRLIQALGQTVGVVGEVRLAQERKEQETRQKEEEVLYNNTISNLEILQKQLDADPTNPELLKSYSETLSSGYNTFSPSTDKGVSIRKTFPITEQMREKAKKSLNSAAQAVQGGYVQTVDRLSVTYESEEELARIGQYNTDDAAYTIASELLESFSQEDRENMTQDTRERILVKAYGIAGKSRSIYETNQSIREERAESAAREGLVNTAVARGTAPSLIDIVDHADLYNKTDVEVISDISKSLVDNFEIALIQGNQNETSRAYNALSQFESSLGEAYPSERLKLVEAINEGVALAVAQDTALFKDAVDDTVETSGSREDLEGTLDVLSVAGFNTKFGTAWTTDRPEEIPPENEMQQQYLKGLIKAKSDELGRYKESTDTISKSLDTMLNPSGTRSTDVNSLVNLERTERGALLENLITLVSNSEQSDEDITDQIMLLQDAKQDNAAWYEVLAAQFRDTDSYAQVFNQTVSKNLDGPVSQDGLRQVIAFVGNDVENVVHLFDDKSKINALTQTMIDSESNPDLDLVDTYNRHLADYQSIRFKEKSGDDEGIDFTTLLQNPDFLRTFTGEERTSLSKNTAETLAAIVNVGSVTAGSARPKAMADRVSQMVKDRGYYLVKQQRDGGGTIVSLVSHTTIPEAVGLDSIKVAESLLQDSRASQYIGTQLRPEGGQSVRDIVLEKIKSTPFILKDPAFADLLTPEAMDSHIERGNLKVVIDTPNASRLGVPIYAVLSNQDGRNPIPIPLGEVNFNDPVVSSAGPDFLKPKKDRSKGIQAPPNQFGNYYWMR